MTDNEKKILNEISENPNITQMELSISLGVSKRSIIKIMSKFKEKGILERVGSNKKRVLEDKLIL